LCDDQNEVPGVTNVFYYVSNSAGISRVIGFCVVQASQGTNLIADPFYQVDDTIIPIFESLSPPFPPVPPPMNSIGALFCGGLSDADILPILGAGTNIYGWVGNTFTTNTSMGNGLWSPNGDIPMLPGTCSILSLPNNSGMTLWYIGIVRQAATNQIVAGTNYVASALPIAGRISTDLHYTNATAGDVLQLYNSNGVLTTYTCNGGSNWSPSEPYIGLAQGFILKSASNHAWTQTFTP
jgi:hypothetical protein